jgi:hypothetical protein
MVQGPYYGTIIGGVALGTVLGVAAFAARPPAPKLNCYWANPARTQGYWTIGIKPDGERL